MDFFRTNKPIDSVDYGHSVIPPNRLSFLEEKCAETLTRIPGSVLEVGVYKGGSLIKMAKLVREICPQYCVFGIDTFEGHPYTDNHPVHPTGKYNDIDLNALQTFIDSQNLTKWIKLFKGKVEDIFFSLNLPSFSFVHIDCDLYKPVNFCSQNIPPKMNEDGIMYFDDYGHEHCPGATKAVNENFKKEQITEVAMKDDNTCWSCFISI